MSLSVILEADAGFVFFAIPNLLYQWQLVYGLHRLFEFLLHIRDVGAPLDSVHAYSTPHHSERGRLTGSLEGVGALSTGGQLRQYCLEDLKRPGAVERIVRPRPKLAMEVLSLF